MSERPSRLQGTDGVRGVMARDTDPRLEGLDPIAAFWTKGLFTPAFVTRYCFAFAREAAGPSEEVVLGWDPRDRGGDFIEAAVRGIRGAGRRAVLLGMAPTTAIPLLMVQRSAPAGIALTASHNPEDQNGLKLFRGPLALKPLPPQETRLTRQIYALPEELPLQGDDSPEPIDLKTPCREAFLKFSLSPSNTWSSDREEFKDLLLVVDPAGGALSGLAREVFQALGALEVLEVNGEGGPLNRGGGVVELEGMEWIEPETFSGPSDHRAVSALFELGRSHREALCRNKSFAAGVVFDADGDRSLLLIYDPLQDRVAVLDGDVIGVHLARYLVQSHPRQFEGAACAFTVESDLGAGAAAGTLGLQLSLTPVGDRWLLWHAGLAWLRALSAKQGKVPVSLADSLADLEAGEADVEALSDLLGGLGREFSEDLGLLRPGAVPFALGAESSGHHITLGWVERPGASSVPLFAGNGLKAAVNALVAISSLRRSLSLEKALEAIHHPFPRSHKRLRYAYYTDRSRFQRGSSDWQEVHSALVHECQKAFSGRYHRREIILPEDPDMLYLALDDAEGVQRGGLYVRNSGTEEKTGVSLQGPAKEAKNLEAVGEAVQRVLTLRLKSPSSLYAGAERKVLKTLVGGCVDGVKSVIPPEVDESRLLREMARQGLIAREGGGWKATGLGLWYAGEPMETRG